MVLIPLNQRLALSRLRTTGPWTVGNGKLVITKEISLALYVIKATKRQKSSRERVQNFILPMAHGDIFHLISLLIGAYDEIAQ